ncbi:Serine/threonine-protein phosphatase 2A 55 kDa regulatory subunit B delta isoform, partial [Trichinella britovi]
LTCQGVVLKPTKTSLEKYSGTFLKSRARLKLKLLMKFGYHLSNIIHCSLVIHGISFCFEVFFVSKRIQHKANIFTLDFLLFFVSVSDSQFVMVDSFWEKRLFRESDVISCVEFNHDGELLATGDKGGRIVIFQRDQSNKLVNGHRSPEYKVFSTFQSHEPEFDYLKSIEIEEKINRIRWLKRKNVAHFLLSTNDKTIKLWKVTERDKRVDGGWNLHDEYGTPRVLPRDSSALHLPKLVPMEMVVEASRRRVFSNAHAYHINSLSVNSDQETFLSSDDLRINLWHIEITNQSFNIVDAKPANMEDLAEVITGATFHPEHCNLFAYSSSRGTIRLCDMRDRALCDHPACVFEEPEDTSSNTFFTEIIASVSDVKFSYCGDYLLTRDYLTLKVWDLKMQNRPLETYEVHDYLRSRLCTLYENDCMFDKFECCWSGDNRHLLTGAYNNFFRTFNRESGTDMTLEATPELAQFHTMLSPKRVCYGSKRRKDEFTPDALDYSKKILHCVWHPQDNIIAAAATNNLYIFNDYN